VLKIGIVLVTTTFFAGLLIAYPFTPSAAVSRNLAQNQASPYNFISTAQAEEVPAPQSDGSQETSVEPDVRQDTPVADVAAPAPARSQAAQPVLMQAAECTIQRITRSLNSPSRDIRGCDDYPRRSDNYARRSDDYARRSDDYARRSYDDDARLQRVSSTEFDRDQDYRNRGYQGRGYGADAPAYDPSYRRAEPPRYYDERSVRAAPYPSTRYPSRYRDSSHDRYAYR